MEVKIAIVGAGPAGLSAYQLLSSLPGIIPLLFDAGHGFSTRLVQHGPENVVNGMGGAGFYSDRKLSTFPAGSGQLLANPYELRHSYTFVLRHLQQVLPHHHDDFERLFEETTKFIGDNNMSSEMLDLKLREEMGKLDSVKLYPSLVLSTFEDACSIIKSYEKFFQKDTVFFDHSVENIFKDDKLGKHILNVKDLSSGKILKFEHVDYILFAMGRFGSLTANKYSIFDSWSDFQWRRLEFGVRVNVGSHPPLREALLNYTNNSENGMVKDPKLKIIRTFMIGGHPVDCEFRTFCVCLPGDSSGSGYVAKSRDIVTGLETFSGSSSYDEFVKREKLPHVYPGSNLGIMIRIRDSIIVEKYYNDIFKHQKDASKVILNVDNDLETTLKSLSEYFPKDLCYALFSGIMEIIHTYSGQPVRGNVEIYAPCIEGTGLYLKVDPRTFQHANHAKIFVAGDMVGHTRGLLQGLATGHLAAKSMVTHIMERLLLDTSCLQDYQSLLLPSFSYNKTVIDSFSSTLVPTFSLVQDCHNVTRNLRDFFKEEVSLDDDHFRTIQQKMFKPIFTGKSLGVIYELHHFFLDTIQTELHFISQKSMIEYIMLCNAIETCRRDLVEKIISDMTKQIKYDFVEWSEKPGFLENIRNTFLVHQFKSCVLALRTRKDLSSREQYTDIPVMQSAYKIMPISSEWYLNATSSEVIQLHEIEYAIVSMACAYLNRFFKGAIERFGFSLTMVRNKIETQEPSVDALVLGENPLYLECHVKVSICEASGTSSAEYYTKKRLIQDLASLFEGSAAVVKDIFNVISVSINLLKHPEHGQQFFLTFRTEKKEEMEFIRKNFSKIMKNAMEMIPKNHELRNYRYAFYTDSEFVIYDDYRDLDLVWFPVTTNFLDPDYKKNISTLISSSKKLFVVTSNVNKFKEIKNEFWKHLGDKMYVSQYTLIEKKDDNEVDLRVSVRKKLEHVSAILPFPCLADSTGLEIEGFDHFPGAQTKMFLQHVGDEGMIQLSKGKVVNARTCMCFYNGFDYFESTAKIAGKIVERSGSTGFGWDGIFSFKGRTLAEMTPEEKSDISMRSFTLDFIFSHEKSFNIQG